MPAPTPKPLLQSLLGALSRMSLTAARVMASDAPSMTEIPLSMLLQGPGPGPATAKWLIRTLAPLLISTMFRNPWLSGTSTW